MATWTDVRTYEVLRCCWLTDLFYLKCLDECRNLSTSCRNQKPNNWSLCSMNNKPNPVLLCWPTDVQIHPYHIRICLDTHIAVFVYKVPSSIILYQARKIIYSSNICIPYFWKLSFTFKRLLQSLISGSWKNYFRK